MRWPRRPPTATAAAKHITARIARIFIPLRKGTSDERERKEHPGGGLGHSVEINRLGVVRIGEGERELASWITDPRCVAWLGSERHSTWVI